MNDNKYAGILRCIMKGNTFETKKGFNKITGEPQIGCKIRLRRKLAKSMANILASKFNLIDKARWKEIAQMSGVGPFIDWSENANVRDALYKHILENAQYKEDDDGTLSGTLAY
jgi:hypothetical protein